MESTVRATGLRGLPLGIGTTFDYSIPFEPMCRLIAEAGFRAITIGGDVAHSGYDTQEGRERIRRVVTEYGLNVDSVHAPFGKDCDISTPDERQETPAPESSPATSPPAALAPVRIRYRPSPARLQAVSKLKTAIDAALALDSQIVVIHSAAEFPAVETRLHIQAARDSLAELIPYAAHRNVRLAVENLSSVLEMQVFEAVLDEFSELGVCYDSSHARLTGNSFGVLQRFRDRIITLHVSDNRGTSDDHILPFEGGLDWEEFACYAARLQYVKTFMLEVETRESAFKDTKEFLAQAFERATCLTSGRSHR